MADKPSDIRLMSKINNNYFIIKRLNVGSKYTSTVAGTGTLLDVGTATRQSDTASYRSFIRHGAVIDQPRVDRVRNEMRIGEINSSEILPVFLHVTLSARISKL